MVMAWAVWQCDILPEERVRIHHDECLFIVLTFISYNKLYWELEHFIYDVMMSAKALHYKTQTLYTLKDSPSNVISNIKTSLLSLPRTMQQPEFHFRRFRT